MKTLRLSGSWAKRRFAALFQCVMAMALLADTGVALAIAIPSPTVCPTAAFPVRERGTLPASPGIWSDAGREGEGWNILFSDTTTPGRVLTLLYYTYDANGFPIWYISDAASYDGGFRGALKKGTWVFGTGGDLGHQTSPDLVQIGEVALRFIDDDQTRAALSVVINGSGGSTTTQCIQDFSRYSPTSGDLRSPDSGVTPNSVNMAFNGAWHDDSRPGWGLLQHMVLIEGPGDTTQYVEAAGIALYNDDGQPRWLLGVSDPTEQAPPLGQSLPINLTYHRKAANGTVSEVGAGTWTRTFQNTDYVEYTLDPSYHDAESITRFHATSTVAGQSPKYLRRLSINSYIVVDRAPCVVYPGQLSCAATINWSMASNGSGYVLYVRKGNASPDQYVVGSNGEETYDIPLGETWRFQVCFNKISGGVQCESTPGVEAVSAEGSDPLADLHDQQPPPQDAVPDHAEGLGAIAGSAGVSGGAATYSVPIPVPPGRRGMQPSLSLNYSSRSGNGIAGMGVSLSAESSVHRCPMTVEQDGYSRAVQLDGSDKLCLDGQRLVAISANYGAAGTVYRTEIESFVRVKQIGDLNSPNTTFEVRDADNQIRIYGAKDGAGAAQVPVSATHLATTLPPMAWMLGERRDPSGNTVRHFYTSSNGEYLLSAIKYTGYRTSASSHTEGTRVINFNYEDRTDTSTSYLGGGRLRQSQRLKEIVVNAPNESVGDAYKRTYALQYAYSPSSARSQLQGITEKNANGSISRPETVLDWHDNTLVRHDDTLASVIPSGLPGNLIGVRIVGDVNGDGHRDLVARGPGGGLYLVALGASRNVLWRVNIKSAYGDGNISDADITTDHFVDIDMDGRADMLGFSTVATEFSKPDVPYYLTFYRFTNMGVPSGAEIKFDDAFPSDRRVVTGLDWIKSSAKISDVNSDGRPDLLVTHQRASTECLQETASRFEVRINVNVGGEPTFPPNNSASVCLLTHADTQNFYTQRVLLTADVNGDSLADVVLGGTGADNDYDQLQLGISKWKYILLGRATVGGAYSLVNPGNPSSTTPAKITDWVVGKTDMSEEDAWGYDEVDALRRTGDINGDGLMDVLWVASRDGARDAEWALRYGNGRGFSPTYWTGLATGLARVMAPNSQEVYINSDKITVADTNGDGKDELVYPTAFANLLCQRIVRDGTPRSQESGCQNAGAYQPERLIHPDDRPAGCVIGSTSMGNNLDIALPQPEVSYACPEDPNTGQYVFQNTPPGIGGGSGADWDLPSHDPLRYPAIPMYSRGFGGLNSSTYKYSSVDIVDFSGSWAARPVSSNMVEIPNEDLFSDGLTDAIYISGCVFSDGDNCGKLKSLANIQPPIVFNFDAPFARTHRISQNLGHGPSSSTDPTPLLPDMLQGVSEPVSDGSLPGGDLTSRVYEWRYSPLSGRADRSSSPDFPLYSLPDSSTAYRDDRHFYFTSSMPVVAEFSASTGVLNPLTSSEFRHTVQYGYGEAMYHAFGRGFQGFRRIVERDLLSRTQTETLFHQRFPLTGRVESQTSYVLRANNTLGRLSRAQTTWACDRSNGAACPDSGANWTSTNFPFVRKEVVETFDAASATSGGTELLLSRKTVLNEAVSLGTSGCPNVPVSAQASGYSALGNLTQRYELVEDVSPEAVLSRQCSRTSSAFDESAIGPDVWWVRKPASTTVEQRVVYAEGAVPSTVASALFQPGSVQTEYVWNSNHRAPASTTVRTVNATENSARNGYQTTTWTYATDQPASKYGQPDSESISGTGVTALRTTRYEYDSAGYFPARVINPLAHAVQTVTRPIDGQPASITDADGRVTRFGYDGFGLLTATYYGPVGDLRQPSAFQGIRPCGPSAGGEPCPAGATAVRIQRAAGSPEVRTYVDGLGREVAVETQLRERQGQVDGPQYNRVETHYNERGLVEWSSQPQAIRDWGDVYLTDLTTSWVPTYRRQVAGYDVLGRPGSVTEPRQLPGNSGAPGGNQKTTYTYVGLTTNIKVEDTTDSSTALTMSRQVDALGRPVLTTDASAAQGKNRYFYDAYGQTVALVDARGVATRAEYDPLGRRWVSNDPNLGTTQFTYNGLGELQTQTDARGRVLTFQYDALGRNTERKTSGGDEFGSGANNWVLDTFVYDPPNARGQLASHRRDMTGTWGSSGTPSTFTERKQSFVYNAQGRLTARNTEQSVNVSRTQTGTRRYSHRYVWDSRWGRLLGEAWPNGVGRGYHYDGVGRVILETGLGTNMPTVLRAVQEIDARGQVVNAELGDCVTGPCIKQIRSYAPSTGQMLEQRYLNGTTELHSERYRHDYLANLSQRERLSGDNLVRYERYTYDALQRLKSTTVDGSSNSVSLDYDAVGNLTEKSDYASTYTYPSVNEARPNAVRSTHTDTSSGPTNQTYYSYDASGNLTKREVPVGSSLVTVFTARYNHNQQPIESQSQIVSGTTPKWESARYLYDAQNRLSRQIEGASGSTPEHLIYLEGYEDRVGGYRTRSYVDDYAHLTRYRYGQLELRFVLTDRLGSVVSVLRADRDNSGHVTALTAESTLAYDVFGTPRDATTWAGLNATTDWPNANNPNAATRHGFTGHEMLSKQRLIHMRGRLFDPRMGRFTGVDPVIQFPLSTQGLNPYSYLFNNPLAGTDPTGYVACSEVSTDTAGSGTCDFTQNGKTTTVGYAVGGGGVAVGGASNMAAVSGAVSMGVLATSTGTMRSVSNGSEVKQTAMGVQRTDRLADKGASGLGSGTADEPSWATRGVGVLRTGAGALGIAATGVACESGVLCGVATSVLGTMSVDAIYTGVMEAWTGLPQDTQTAKLLMSAGISNRAAGYAEMGIGFLAGGANIWLNSAKVGAGGLKGTTSLFRAVGPDELADIYATNALRNLGSAEGKYFTTSAVEAAAYAKQAVKAFGDQPYTIIRTDVPNGIFRSLSPAVVDRGIPAWVIPTDRLPGLVPRVMDHSPLPPMRF